MDNANDTSSSSSDQLKVIIGSFNSNGQHPGRIAIDDWLHIQRDDADILIVGILEAEASNLSFVLWTPYVQDAWNVAIESAMGSKLPEFEKLTCEQLVGTMILVYVRKQVSPRITGVSASSQGIGLGGVLGNKGAVAVRFDLDGEHSFCFVVSHLSASEGAEARERRRWDFSEIVKRLRFTIIDGEDNSAPANTDTEKGSFVRDAESMLRAQLKFEVQRRNDQSLRDDVHTRQFSIMDHDVIFWAGDLNWRLDLGIEEVKRLIEQKEYESVLLRFDQLRSEIQTKSSFDGFQEQEITFAPTYKFDRGTQNYDTSEKNRVPAWTDRIIWKQKSDIVHPIHYESCPSICISDHKPISASFMLRLSKQ